MEFESLYYGDRLRRFNPGGDVGVVTLWSKVDQAVKVLHELNIDLDERTSRIAVIGNLYGNGLPHMLRNLLWNPQIAYLLIVGQDLSGSRGDLISFFENGLEEVQFLGAQTFKIIGRNRVIDGLVKPSDFKVPPKLTALGKLSAPETLADIQNFFSSLEPPLELEGPRQKIDLPEIQVTRFPTEARSNVVLRDSPLEAWKELIFRLHRFGHRSALKKGERIELQNLKVVVSKPDEDADTLILESGFDPDKFRDYQKRILSPIKPEDLEYTYGHRIRGYFRHQETPVDGLEIAIQRLKADPETRHAYISIWDSHRDLPEGHGCPCLVSLFFRRFEEKLTLTATFRTHNAVDAWLENFWGLIAIQRFVAEASGMERGPITVFSHSISVSADSLEKASRIADQKTTDDVINPETGKREPRMDHNGSFTVTVDHEAQEIVVEHSFQGMPLKTYRSRHAQTLEHELARDCAVSEIAHALYLGREIARAEMILRKKQDKA